MKLFKAGMVVVSLLTLAGCSSSNSSVADNDESAAGDLDGDENLTDNESSPSLDETVAFPELQGVWTEDCELYDPDEPEEGYAISTWTCNLCACKNRDKFIGLVLTAPTSHFPSSAPVVCYSLAETLGLCS